MKGGACSTETYLGESVLVQNTLLELATLSGKVRQLGPLGQEYWRTSGDEGARQSDDGRLHFGLTWSAKHRPYVKHWGPP